MIHSVTYSRWPDETVNDPACLNRNVYRVSIRRFWCGCPGHPFWRFWSGCPGSTSAPTIPEMVVLLSWSHISTYHSRDGGAVVLVPHERLGGDVTLGGLGHLLAGAVDALLLQVHLKPVVLVPSCGREQTR